jgi:hypothetical protein
MGMRRLGHTGWVVALAAGVLLATSAAIAETGSVSTHTALTTESIQAGSRTVTAYSATVTGEDGVPLKGVVNLTEHGKTLAGAALDASGTANIRLDGLAGDHNLTAVYSGDSAHAASTSEAVSVHADAIPADGFGLAISPTSLTVAAPGDAANVTASITSGSSFTGFVEFSCAGAPVSPGSATDNALPYGVSCTFTPENLQVTASSTTYNSTFSVLTTAPAGAGAMNRTPHASGSGTPLALAILLPGIAGLGWLGRKRKLFSRMALLTLVGAITVLGTSSCAARYKYLHHPPTYNGGTAAGDYTLTVWAQTSDGVTASEVYTTMALTIK